MKNFLEFFSARSILESNSIIAGVARINFLDLPLGGSINSNLSEFTNLVDKHELIQRHFDHKSIFGKTHRSNIYTFKGSWQPALKN